MSPIEGALLNAGPADEPHTSRGRANPAEPDDAFGQAFSAVTNSDPRPPSSDKSATTPAASHDASSSVDSTAHGTGSSSAGTTTTTPAAASTSAPSPATGSSGGGSSTSATGDGNASASSAPLPGAPGSTPSAPSNDGVTRVATVPDDGGTGLLSQTAPDMVVADGSTTATQSASTALDRDPGLGHAGEVRRPDRCYAGVGRPRTCRPQCRVHGRLRLQRRTRAERQRHCERRYGVECEADAGQERRGRLRLGWAGV